MNPFTNKETDKQRKTYRQKNIDKLSLKGVDVQKYSITTSQGNLSQFSTENFILSHYTVKKFQIIILAFLFLCSCSFQTDNLFQCT